MNVTDIIRRAEAEGRTRFAFEMLPPLKGAGAQGVFDTVESLREFDPAYVNITFHREGIKQTAHPDGRIEWHNVRRRPGTVGIAAAIRRRFSIETVPHLICGGLSRYDVEDALIDMDFLGLHNVLALRGDAGPNERHFMPHPQGHAHAIDLVRQIAAMNRGQFVDGEADECHHSRFTIGVAGYPEVHADARDAASDIRHLREKVDAGADYIVTQLSFDNARILDFIGRCREAGIRVPIVVGIKPFSSVRQLETLPRIFSITLPEALAAEVRAHAHDPEAVRTVGVEWAVAQCRELMAAGIPVLHFYTMGRAESTRRIARELF